MVGSEQSLRLVLKFYLTYPRSVMLCRQLYMLMSSRVINCLKSIVCDCELENRPRLFLNNTV